MADAFQFKDGVYGRRAVLQTDWAVGMARFLIVELELNMGSLQKRDIRARLEDSL